MVEVLNSSIANKLVHDYIHQDETITSYFAYDYQRDDTYEQRVTYLQQRDYQRDHLVAALHAFNAQYTSSEHVRRHIDQLHQSDATVVVGGQQAGLLTGPAMTIYKCISVIKFAREREKQLGTPVIPVFWIAGEDHDFAEINHVNVNEQQHIKKMVYQDRTQNKQPVSEIGIDDARLKAWVNDVFQAYGESDDTQSLLDAIYTFIDRSETIVDFFAYLLHDLFSQYGLVLLDSCDKRFRQLESAFFEQMIHQSETLSQNVQDTLFNLNASGYHVNLDASATDAHLFYHDAGERKLLERVDEVTFKDKHDTIRLTKDELLRIAREQPERLSNNVVTRPLMQEMLLPTLAFVGGPGEISYWSALKTGFEAMSLAMPPVIPRLNVTLVSRDVCRWLKDKNYSIGDVLTEGLEAKKQAWLREQNHWPIDETAEQVTAALHEYYQPLKDLAGDIDPNLQPLADKNRTIIEQQIEYIRRKMMKSVEQHHDQALKKFDNVQMDLKPDNQPQERTWSIYYFINAHSKDLIDRLLSETYSFDGRQYLFYM
ncbi:bacillithiol biosynthesis cysteine-adding enzyme BshC [Tuberibacillus sp. Marseille-P3662]|uniref:bacillithiol biosynthesis cysteine-adding enzyme BshC n=1 Tax=Tuberibacillus sp. Marseille-P3662 TaxID=1965358 RepID=UPI000A1C9C7A|nr:bacillithiol biosynthesis cysteine-adding enzyme BshC [Tuberibacillus sp. Marseille-P3662]